MAYNTFQHSYQRIILENQLKLVFLVRMELKYSQYRSCITRLACLMIM